MAFDVVNYQSKKTVKLSDAYVVEIVDKDSKGAIKEFTIAPGVTSKDVLDSSDGKVNCYLNHVISVKLPNLKITTDQLKYNYFMHSFVRLDLDSTPDTLDITLYETSDEKVKQLINYLLRKNGFDENNVGENTPFGKLSNLNIYVLNNNLTKSVYVYSFAGLKLANYDYSYSYDYKDTSLPQVSLSFSFEEFSFGPHNALVFYDVDTVKDAESKADDYKPNIKSIE